ncbi:MAG: hypothetical protein RIT26_2493 [Pseudomonadota bacterium]|jgi:hypothetical protein
MKFKIVSQRVRSMVFAWSVRGSVVLAGVVGSAALMAQPNPGPTCSVAEFRRIALTVGNPTERVEAAMNWLTQRGQNCDAAQLNLIQSNLPGWLGSALTGEITVMVESLQEAKLAKDPNKLKELFSPEVKTFEPSKETTTNPRPRAPVVNANPAPGVVVGGAMGVPVPVPVPAIVPPPDLSGRVTSPTPQFAPDQKTALTAWLNANLSVTKGQECPDNMKVQGEICVSVRPRRWKLGEPLPPNTPAKDLPAQWNDILKLPPEGFRYIWLNEDILLIQNGTELVADQILDYGGYRKKPKS